MTAPTPDPGLRDKLAERLAQALHFVGYRGTKSAVAALMPVVERIARERAAAELEDAAEDMDANTNHVCDNPRDLRARAAALRGQA